jgi:hypothetical protein
MICNTCKAALPNNGRFLDAHAVLNHNGIATFYPEESRSEPITEMVLLMRLQQDIINTKLDIHNAASARELREDELVALQSLREFEAEMVLLDQMWRAAWMEECIARITRTPNSSIVCGYADGSLACVLPAGHQGHHDSQPRLSSSRGGHK